MNRHCMECKRPMTGRADKRFCSNVCRTNFHNRKNKELNALIRQVNSVLRHNRRVLAALAPAGTVHRMALLRDGFDFRYYTHLGPGQDESMSYHCYDYGYELLDEDWVRIFRLLPEVPPNRILHRNRRLFAGHPLER